MNNPTNDIQQCIQKCQQTAQQLRNLANQAPNPQVGSILKEGAHHLNLCVEECNFSLQELQAPAPAMV